MLSKKSTLVLIVAMVLVASVMFVLAVAPASAQRAKPTDAPTATPTATATVKPAVPTATAVPPTATKVPPTATAVPPTATKVPPTATKVPTKAPAVRAPKSGGPPGGGFYSGQTIMNTSSSTANVNVTVYDSSSTNTYVISHTILSGALWNFISNDSGFSPALPSGFQGSAVVSSDQAVKSVVNVTNSPSGGLGVSGGTAAEQYDGVDGSKVSTSVAFPLAKASFGSPSKTSAFYIQNVGSLAASFHATFQMGPSLTGPFTTYTYDSPTINPGQMAVVSAGDASAPAGTIGSLTVTSSQNIAGTVLEYETSTSPALILQATNGWTPSDYDTTLYLPVVKKTSNTASGYTRSTGVQIQNVTTNPISVTMTYYGFIGACAGTTYPDSAVNVGAGQSVTFLNPAILPNNCIASAKAVGTGNIAALVNEAYFPCPSGCVQRANYYSPFPSHVATAGLVAPLYKQRLGCKWTGLTIQNLNLSTTANASAVFNVSGTTYTLHNISINPNSGVTLLDVAHSIPSGSSWVGSALPDGTVSAVTVSSSTNIVAIANEAVVPSSTDPSCASVSQNNKNYEAFNQ